jgi:hypothetical protein
MVAYNPPTWEMPCRWKMRFFIRMVLPLSDSKKKYSKEQQEKIFLACCKAAHHAANSNDRDEMPPMLNLKPGEKLVHILGLNAQSDGKNDLLSNGKKTR